MWIVEAGADDRDPGVVGHQQRRHAANCRQSAIMCLDPVRQGLGPGRLGIGEARCAENGDEDLGRTRLAGEPVDHHGHRVAGIIDEQP